MNPEKASYEKKPPCWTYKWS